MTQPQPNNPLHGVKLEDIIIKLEKELGWQAMGEAVNIRCFTHDPSVKSSLKFLRKTPWAREKVEQLYLDTFHGFVWPTIKK
ncbi:VF530 family DNA-binding protein [Pseudoalteromonas sp. T1lg23B]|uniref:VF530 family protein n=1 Tax=Pseudoalteromonas sp. T1lg23B TaxID=2077097 RepID=UPI000CF68404|nr:VF530 family protein [Pseudoalteromonas sp. T1lg23B]